MWVVYELLWGHRVREQEVNGRAVGWSQAAAPHHQPVLPLLATLGQCLWD
jgi:hypothetical protein